MSSAAITWIKQHLALLPKPCRKADAAVCRAASIVGMRRPTGRPAADTANADTAAPTSPSAMLIRLLAEHVVASPAEKVEYDAGYQ